MSTAATTRNYAEAVNLLNSLQSNKATLDALKASGGRLSQYAIPEMIEYLERIGYTTSDLNKLNVIHITGTKGKGSTCAFINSILMKAKPDWKIGLYTSPHMVAVRERLRINGAPISEDEFAKYFFEVWDRLEANPKTKEPSTPAKPMYFRFVTLVAFHAYLSLGVDATILEVGVGGAYDSTNIVPKPFVTGITALGIDHVGVLGNTLAEIAWQKAGIYKKGVPALSVEQPSEGMAVVKEQAAKRDASSFTVVPINPKLSEIKLGLAGDHQRSNASLAVQVVRTFLDASQATVLNEQLSENEISGVKGARWPGRCQTVSDVSEPNIKWHLDGAHTTESLAYCMEWFVAPGVALPASKEDTIKQKRILIFNCTHGRTGTAFLTAMLQDIKAQLLKHGYAQEDAGQFFDQVLFCTNVTYIQGGWKSDLTSVSTPDDDLLHLKTQRELADTWQSLVPNFPKDNIHALPTIEHAVNIVKKSHESHTNVLVTGSLHLVGGLIEAAHLADVAL